MYFREDIRIEGTEYTVHIDEWDTLFIDSRPCIRHLRNFPVFYLNTTDRAVQFMIFRLFIGAVIDLRELEKRDDVFSHLRRIIWVSVKSYFNEDISNEPF